MKDETSNFYSRDDNSRVTTGRRDTISRHGETRQRRVLLDTLQNLHKKYNAVYPTPYFVASGHFTQFILFKETGKHVFARNVKMGN